ncbi:MAG: hypothetical protein U5R31_02875 [Acidimicrobiia bacterium]|nr:hypothetical protein [Acidimicrobiia bacterium]
MIDATEPANPSVVADLSLDAVATRIEDVYGSAIERRKQDARTSSDRS